MRFFNTHIGRCATLLALGSGIALYSQGTQTASATVTVVDSSGNPVAGARVRMTSPSLMAERTGATNNQGVFVARLLPPGNYTIEITAGGFQTARTTRNIGMDQHFQPRMVLQTVAGAVVDVIASASSAVDPTSVQTSSNYDAKRIDELPMGRDLISMALLTPGVTTGHGANDVQIRGGMGSSNLFLMDGQNLMDNVFNSFGFAFINDSFEETQVITGAISAEYGNVDGGVVNTLTKSGGNRFSGQYRVDMSNPAWNATRPWTTYDRYGTNTPTPAQIAAGGTAPPRAANVLSEERIYTLGGYFWKDKLWFHVSMLERESGAAGSISTLSTNTGPEGRGANYVDKREVERYLGKLTYLINQDHTIIGTYSWTNQESGPYVNLTGYPPGEFDSLGYQVSTNWFYNLSWRAIWSPTVNTEVRYGAKKQSLDGGGWRQKDYDNVDNSQIRDAANGLMYNGGQWRRPAPDLRSNQTANIKGSWFVDWNGVHEIDFGFDYYKGMNESSNAQGPTDYTFYALDFNGDTRSGIPWYMIRWFPSYNTEARSTTMGIYVNDKWKFDNKLSFQIGVRYDTYKADADDVITDIASSSGFSPRLGVTYDLFGDQTWIFKMSYCRYNAAVLESITGAVSGAGNPSYGYYLSQNYWDVYQTDPSEPNYATLAQVRSDPARRRDRVTNPAEYPYYLYSIRPLWGTEINPDLKAPCVDEFQISASYSFATKDYGKGYVSLTAVWKDWSNLIDYSIGNNGWLNDPDLGENTGITDRVYVRVWDNQPLAERKYNALEFVADWTYDKLHVSGNITWSSLKGNYEGEAGNQPGIGAGLDNYRLWKMEDSDPIKVMYDTNFADPYGYLARHRPLMMNWMAEYVVESTLGRTTFGFLYTLEHGLQYSYTRPLAVTAPGVVPGGYTGSLSDQLWRYFFGSTITQGMDNKRTNGKYNTLVYHDLAVTQDFKLFKVYDYQVSAFVKLQIRNFFNHMQIYSWDTRYQHNNVTAMDAPWVPGPQSIMGTVRQANYGAARTILLSAGVRF